ncbi:MAG TPA: NAD(P)-binding domain-containing protein [Anaerovoracaceae bacterium]|nr:NAD(P)-binding domain-containing protein [Anaerovoracaceae bacterium]
MLKEFTIETSLKEETIDTIVIGGGQSGLATGYFLSHQGKEFVILDNNSRTGDIWRSRWESLRLFTPSQFDSLPGLPFLQTINYLPSKNEIADYLETYASYFNLPIRHNIKVDSLTRNEKGYIINTNDGRFFAKNVIIATGPYQLPYTPELSIQLDTNITQIHSSKYQNPKQIPVNNILVVGAGNSGAEIALDLIKTGKKVWLAGRDVGRVPANSPAGKFFNGRPIWWIMTHMLTIDTPIGRKMQTNSVHHGTPLGRATRAEIAAAGVTLSPRLSNIVSGKPQLENAQIIPAEAVIWATGFKPDYSWIKMPIFDAKGYPVHDRGVIKKAAGLYFIGLFFQTGLSSSFLGGVGKDAAFITALLAKKNG